MRKTKFQDFWLSCFTIMAIAIPTCAAEPQPRFTTDLHKADDSIAVEHDSGTTAFTIISPSGIGSVKIARHDATWPKVVVLKLRLTGLESLRLSHGKRILGAAVSSRDGQLSLRQWKGDNETPVDTTDPLHLDMQILDAKGKPATTLPLKDGRFEVRLPAAFLSENPESITIAWIDFYR